MPVRSWLRLGGYAAALVVVLAVGFWIGRQTLANQPAAARADDRAAATVFGGVTVSASGYTLSAEQTTLHARQAITLRLRVIGPDGRPVLRYGWSPTG